jgi:hypothetical protein
MKQIQPVSIWKDGQEKSAEFFTLRSIADDLSSSATFYYELKAKDEEGNASEVLGVGNLSLGQPEYDTWDGSNDWAYSWALGALNLVEA